MNNPSEADPFGQIADEFVEAFRQGRKPSVEEYARRYPEHADEIRDILPALVLMEKAKAAEDASEQGRPTKASPAAVPMQQLGDYQILREIGRGGMGIVYEARQLSLGRHVAIKVLPPHALLDARQLARFQREARSAAKLHHTNIVPVFGVGEQDGLHYYVMQFIQGLGLDLVEDELRRLRQAGGKPAPTQADAQPPPTSANQDVSAAEAARALLTGVFRRHEPADALAITPGEPAAGANLGDQTSPRAAATSATIRLPGRSEGFALSESGQEFWRSVARIGVQVADALAHAASLGVLHRDIKPSNLLLDGAGNVWVTDFGLAKTDTDGDNLTQSGDVVGTLRYLAPERFSGQGDVRSDVYSLGLTLYELLTLRSAFDETDRSKLVKQVMYDEPVRPRKLNPAVPRDLETVVLKAIARDPAHRYQTPAEMAEDLKRFVDDRPIRARGVSTAEKLWRWGRRNPLPASLLAGIMLLFLTGFAAVFQQWRVAEKQRMEAEKQTSIAADKERVAEKQRMEAEKQRMEAEKQTSIAADKEKEARKEADKAKKARDFLVRVFELSDVHGQRGTMTARQILDDAERRIPQEFADQPELQAELLAAIDAVYAKITANAPLAMILETSGTVRLHSTREPNRRPVPQTLLYAGDRLSLSAEAEVQLVILSDLHKERLRPGTEVTIRRKGCEPADAVRERDPDVLMTFVRLPKRTFYMGWGGGNGFDDRGKKTEIQEDFEIATHDVTQGQWQAIMGDNPSSYSRFGGWRKKVKDISDEELKLFPVENVSWDDAQEFIRKLNERNAGRGYLYRLPTEAEWEYACRGGATTEEECSFHFYFDKPTNNISTGQANYNGNLPDQRFPNPDVRLWKSTVRPTRVGAYPPNKLGLCDMHGNVWQWCADPEVPRGSNPSRVVRGGAWNNSAQYCRAGCRAGFGPRIPNEFVGFRLVRVPVRPG
jgi:formylglycine-generating enzyme required for sulfatase activity/serine/threonine protein kinase